MIAAAVARRGSVEAAIEHLVATQDRSGSWTGDYGGPLFLLPLFIATARVTGYPLDADTRAEMERYLRTHQRDDGGWGLHVEGASHVFPTALSYVALRYLGVGPGDPHLGRAREFLALHGGPCASASWGKFALAVLGLYDWEGIRPVPPETWLLPEASPIHPSRLWCHARMVYLPMSYLYARRATAPLDATTASIRSELYGDAAWNDLPWRASRDTVASTDRYVPLSASARWAFRAASAWERVVPAAVRARAIRRVLDVIRAEDRATEFICLGPVNKLFNTLVWHFESPGGPEVARHKERLSDYLWHAGDGVKMQGYNSSQLWDTALAVQALLAAGATDRREAIVNAHGFVRDNQVLEDVADRASAYRDSSRGGWPFSTRAHGWPISDCTAEGLKVSLLLAPMVDDPLPAERLEAAAVRILAMQNDDGGWASYERTRGARWLERLNPSDCFSEIMTDISYVECTSACVQGLAAFTARYPDFRSGTIRGAIDRGREFLLRAQRPDGSFEGSWGICFTYGTWYGVSGLRASGLPSDHPAVRRAVAFLTSHQLRDGGWGETPDSCRTRAYVHADSGQAVMTSWSILALVTAGEGEGEAVARGVAFLERRQRDDGSFPPEHIAGVFNRTCAIHYDNYLKIFPLWALASARRPEAGTQRGDPQ